MIVPQVNSKGTYVVTAPFDTDVLKDVVYECLAIRALSDYAGSGTDAYAEFYKDKGISESSYTTDLGNNVLIVKLRSSDNKIVYVPTNYISAYPESNGVPYTSICMAVFLGAIPDDLELSPITSKVSEVILATLGLETDIHITAVSAQEMISQANHELAEAARKDKITENMTYYQKYLAEHADLLSAKQKITELENFIKEKLLTQQTP